MTAWIGVDLDGTLAYYDGWKGVSHIGWPIPSMVERVKKWLEAGIEVRILTARVGPARGNKVAAEIIIRSWCWRVFGRQLPVTCVKDQDMIELWDDRVVQVVTNTGEPVEGSRSRAPGGVT